MQCQYVQTDNTGHSCAFQLEEHRHKM